uniref:Deoxyribonuclease II n=1 Tax=Syphacia muris TaxID=451379 RepID=A0A0N5AHZ8_9BILA
MLKRFDAMLLLLQVILLTALNFEPILGLLWCKDQNNQPVDWYMALKMPKKSESNPPGISTGHGFYYLDYNKKTFAESSVPLNSKKQAIGYTLEQLYNNLNNPDVFYLMYNDEEASPTNRNASLNISMSLKYDDVQFGHMKGKNIKFQQKTANRVLLFDGKQGFWLVHSVPQFPPQNQYAYPTSGTVYGQNFLCMTFDYSQLGKIGKQLYYNHPLPYFSQLPTHMASEYPDLAKAVASLYKSGGEKSNVEDLITVGGIQFTSFAKTHQFNADLYSTLVANHLQTGLYVETWKRGLQVELVCPPPTYPVYDIQYLKVSSGKVYFKTIFF